MTSNRGQSEKESESQRYLSFLLKATEVLSGSLQYRETLQNVCTAAVSTIADVCIVDVGPPGETTLGAAAHRDPALAPEIRGAGKHLESEDGRPMHPVCQVLAEDRTYFVPDIDERWIEQNASRTEHAEYLRRLNYRSMIIVPLRSRVYGLRGALTLVTTEGGCAPFTSGTIPFAEALARLCASSIGKAQLFEEAQSTARMFQEAALPRVFPQRSSAKFFAHYEPAGKLSRVGGDWYDAFQLPEGAIGICIGDASGHGIRAAVTMASMRNALRAALVMEANLTRALDVVDFVVRAENVDDYVTALLAIFDAEVQTLRVASAGHPGPKIWDSRTQQVLDPFTARDLPLGLRNLTDERAQPATVRLEPGSLAVFYTDGLVEFNQDLLRGEQTLYEAIRDARVRDARNPATAIREAVIGNAKPQDDLAILVLSVGNEAIECY